MINSAPAQALELFNEIVEMSDPARSLTLMRLSVTNPQVHSELVTLLKADTEQFPLLENSPLSAFKGDIPDLLDALGVSKIGSMFGAWRAVGILGHGGMGVVYAVERSDGRHRQSAALKLIRMELSSSRLISAFLSERDHLASLSHPGIVPLLDSGIDDQGQPWFVMRQVNGQPIETWCDEHRLSLRERIILFLEACDAVTSAHERGILHQDIKPSNLLVTPDGRTQLLDFGLATTTMQAEPNAYQGLAMTAHYTAPEVLQGAYPSVSADIYALGVLLYRLLCGQYPIRLDHSMEGLLPSDRAISPESPSHLARQFSEHLAQQRHCKSARALSRKLVGDLDAIALTCVNPSPDQRYRSVTQLQHDLRHWLDARPVTVGPNTFVYRARRFVKRHTLAVVITASVTAMIIAVSGFGVYQQLRAQQEMAVASEVDQLFEKIFSQATLSSLNNKPLSPTILLARTEAQLRAQAVNEPDVLARGLAVLARNWALAGNYEKSETLAQEASQLSRSNLQQAFDLVLLAQAQNLAANFPQAEQSARGGLSKLSFNWSAQHRLANVLLNAQLAEAQSGQGHSAEAIRTINSALATAEKLDPAIGNIAVAELLMQRGTWLRNQIRFHESEKDLVRAIALAEPIDPLVADDARESLMLTLRYSSLPNREARLLPLAKQLLQSRQQSLGMMHPETGAAWADLAFEQMHNNDNVSAKASIDEAQSILDQSPGDHQVAWASIYLDKADLKIFEGDPDAAMGWTNKALKIYRERFGPAQELTLQTRHQLAIEYWSRANLRNSQEDQDKARDIIGLVINDSVTAYGTVSSTLRIVYATLLVDSGKIQEAANQLAQAHADTITQYGAESLEMLHYRLAELSFLIDSHADDNRIKAAAESLVIDAKKANGLYAQSIEFNALTEQARWLKAQHRVDDARASLLQAGEVAKQANEPGMQKELLEKLKELDSPSAKP
jgi:eukaryotic-like serine/threonine-protein kinase